MEERMNKKDDAKQQKESNKMEKNQNVSQRKKNDLNNERVL